MSESHIRLRWRRSTTAREDGHELRRPCRVQLVAERVDVDGDFAGLRALDLQEPRVAPVEPAVERLVTRLQRALDLVLAEPLDALDEGSHRFTKNIDFEGLAEEPHHLPLVDGVQ